MARAVVFDLWETLAAWPREDMTPLLDTVGLSASEWSAPEQRDLRWTGPFQAYLESLGLDGAAIVQAGELRTAMTRRSLVPVDGAPAVLQELRSRQMRIGLVSNCSSEVGDLWGESPFAGLFDAVVLSAQVGFCKPDERIYRVALERLGVDPAEAMFVGDGESDELVGAESAALRAVQLGDRDGWRGERIDSLEELLALV